MPTMDEDAWDIIEVKSCALVKDVYLSDLAFQCFVYSGAGLKIRRCFVFSRWAREKGPG